ncbi:ribonuclease HII [Clostridia bacterium]|nr:ribonuclease HII [Clostridia bacterium]
MSIRSDERRGALVAYDSLYWTQGLRVAGMDEAGCGALAGPVIAACVGMQPGSAIPGVDDSKKLSPAQRANVYDKIVESAWFIGIGSASVEEIESLNILNATRLAMVRAAQGLESDLLLVDSRQDLPIACAQLGITHGDATSYSIAAASIVAKVTRDRLMESLDADFAEYGFAKHKGYGTAAHYETILRFGPSILHRPSFLRNLSEKVRA